MKFKLILAIVDDRFTDKIVETARSLRITGATIIPTARDEGLNVPQSLLDLELSSHRD